MEATRSLTALKKYYLILGKTKKRLQREAETGLQYACEEYIQELEDKVEATAYRF